MCVWARGDACRAGCGVRVCARARGDAAQPRSPAHMYCTRALSLTRALSRIAADALARIGSGGSQVHSLVGSGVSQVGAQVLGPRCLASRVAGQVRAVVAPVGSLAPPVRVEVARGSAWTGPLCARCVLSRRACCLLLCLLPFLPSSLAWLHLLSSFDFLLTLKHACAGVGRTASPVGPTVTGGPSSAICVNTVGCYGNVWSITFALTIAVDRRRNENASTKVLNETTLTERAPNPW